MFKTRGPWDGKKKPLLSLQINAQLVLKFVKKYKYIKKYIWNFFFSAA